MADVPEHIHRQVRVRCMERGLLMRDYILGLVEKDLAKKPAAADHQ